VINMRLTHIEKRLERLLARPAKRTSSLPRKKLKRSKRKAARS